MKLVVSSGAGISAESGMMTYRDAGGLWDNYPVMEVASDEGFARNPALIHQFYSNLRTKMTQNVMPPAAHKLLAEMEKDFDVQIITQNVDDLHERAGSTHVLHLHGELMKVRSMNHPERVYKLPCDQL
ncbi:MAG: NAD-dependent deacylase, partial [Muribaculaceae bacterium]|nr:NAD-dependent deacylase [Muribaculaceae bacterium]